MMPFAPAKVQTDGPSNLSLVYHVVERFDAAWQAALSGEGEFPQIEAFLGDVAAANRSAVLQELLAVEVECRAKRGEVLCVTDYQARFPDAAHQIATWLARDVKTERSSLDPQAPTLACGEALTVAVEGPRPTPPDFVRSTGAKSFPRRFGNYELLEEIARGGMGVVYKARQLGLNRVVAVKMILSGEVADLESIKRFQTEAAAAAELRHPGIVSVFEVGECDNRHYFSMEYVEGPSLAVQARNQPYSPSWAAQVVQSIARAIQYAHEHKVLHRDLKPSNVLMEADGRPRVTDFGLAKRISEQDGVTHSCDIIGTPAYMSPEQAAGRTREIGPASDVYSLGAILYELLTGRPPFRADTSLDTILQVVGSEPVSPRILNPKTPRDLETICLKCLQKAPAKRFASALDLAADLERFIAGTPILARPTPFWEVAAKWSKRRPTAAALVVMSAVVLVGLIASTALLSAANKREREATKLADAARLKAESKEKEARAQESKAIAQEKEATRQAQTATAVVGYMTGLFDSSNPIDLGVGPRCTTQVSIALGDLRGLGA